MPTRRAQVGPLQGPVQLQPQATPVDTFHRPDVAPANEGPTELQQLGVALGQVAPSVFRTADIQFAQDTNQKLSEGEQAVLADKRLQNRKALRDAVASGQIPAAQNPWFMQGMRQQVYRIEGNNYDSALRQAYTQSDAQNQDDISGFMGGFTQKYLENLGADASDPEVSRILTPAMERSQANLAAAHRNQRDQAIQQTVEQNTGIEIGTLLDNMEDNPSVAPDDYAKSIHSIIQDQYHNGLSGTRSNEIVAGTITQKALEKLDTSYLDLLDKIPSGPDGKANLGQVGYVKELRRKTEEQIYHALEERDRVSAKQAEDDKKKQSEEGLKGIFSAIIDKPGTNIKAQLKALAQVDPEAAQKAYGWQQSQINGADNIVEDEDTVVQMTAATFAGNGDLTKIMDAQRHGLINKQTATKLAENIEKSKEFRSTLRDSTVRELHDALGKAIRGNDMDFKESNAINATRAQNAFLGYMLDYKGKHPELSEGELTSYAIKQQQELLKAYAPDAAAEAKVPVDSKTAFIVDPAAVNWQQDSIWTSDQLTQVAKEYNASGKSSGELVNLAQRLGVTPQQLFTAQMTLSQKPKTQPKK